MLLNVQVNLHGFDEGLVQKLNYGVFHLAYTEAALRHGQPITEVQLTTLLLRNVRYRDKMGKNVIPCYAMYCDGL
jgi:hypothetical protein